MRFALLFCFVTAVLLNGCAAPRQLVTIEFEPVAYMVEDLAHGIDRDVDALISERASAGQLGVASWLHSEIRNDQLAAYPTQIAQRRRRWAVLASGIRSAAVELHPSGKLKLADGIDADARRLYDRVVSDENRDRDRCDSILLSLSKLDPFSRKAVTWTHTIRRIRHQLDQEYAHDEH